MSTFSLTRGSEAALGMLASQAGTETLLLTQPARDLRAELSIEPFTSDSGNQLLAVLFMREQRHSMTLQRDDGANVQHLADWIEAVANGTLDTAEAIPQRATPAPLLPCSKCNGAAIGYDYSPSGNAFIHGVKCRYRGCQAVEGADTETEAHDAWNALQLEQLADPSALQAATAAFHAAARELNAQTEPAPVQDERELPDYLNDAFDNLVYDNYERSQAGSRNRQADADLIRAALATRPAQTAWTSVEDRLPDPALHARVLIFTDGYDFAGEQYFDVKAESLNEYSFGDPDDQPEPFCKATHWMPLPAASAPQSEQSGLVEALADAAQSLETISNGAGKDEFMQDMADVRGYARSRAGIARAALATSPTA